MNRVKQIALLVLCMAFALMSHRGSCAVATIAKPKVPLPLQPFTVELLDMNRGRWHFSDALGQHLHLDGPVIAYAFAGQSREEVSRFPQDDRDRDVRLAYLCCDPEFPQDLTHAVLKTVEPTQPTADTSSFRVEEPYFSCAVSARSIGGGVFRCELRDITLGPATTGDRYVEGLYLFKGQRTELGSKCAFPLYLASNDANAGSRLQLLTDRVGNVFTENEPASVTLLGLCPDAAQDVELSLQASDYATGEVLWREHLRMAFTARSVAARSFTVPLKRFGVFDVSVEINNAIAAHVRVCRVPNPKHIDPDASAMGINLFQQQVWWHAFQAPLMAKAGVHWIRPWLAWENTWNTQEPERGKWDARALDAALRRMEKYGLRYQDILFQAPAWVSGGKPWGAPTIDRMDEWAKYVEKLVALYKGRIRHYEVWNEPDGMWPEETRHAGEHYLAMLKSTWEAAKRADPRCVILGLSHAGYEAWLENVGKSGAAAYMDVATIHVYAQPKDFVREVQKRQEILKRHGMGHKTLWINELGTGAYDFSPDYSAKFGYSERKQAGVLTTDYAQALSIDPSMKAFWFCTYDPRDAAHESDWTGDAGVGVLYLGFLPKLSYAALAGFAREIDGKKCLGRADPASDLHQSNRARFAVSFDGPVAVVWDDRADQTTVAPATQLGCLPEERIIVRDMFTNPVASGRAGDMKLDFSRGPLFLEGSRQMAGIARAEKAVQVEPEEIAFGPELNTKIHLTAPPDAKISVTTQPNATLSARPLATETGDRKLVLVSVRDGTERVSGVVLIRVTVDPPALGLIKSTQVARVISVTAGGGPNLIRDGSFSLGDLSAWTPERKSVFTRDPDVGHNGPGCLRLDAPFDRRLVHWNIVPKPGLPLKLRGWVKTDRLSGCVVTLNVAFFSPDKWLKTWCLATNSDAKEIEPGWPIIEAPGKIPMGSTDWTLVEATLPPRLIPPAADHAAFFVDAQGGRATRMSGEGRIWIDDLDLWEPVEKN